MPKLPSHPANLPSKLPPPYRPAGNQVLHSQPPASTGPRKGKVYVTPPVPDPNTDNHSQCLQKQSAAGHFIVIGTHLGNVSMPLTRGESHGSGCPWPKPPSRGQQTLLMLLGKPGTQLGTQHTLSKTMSGTHAHSTLPTPSLIFTLTELAWY